MEEQSRGQPGWEASHDTGSRTGKATAGGGAGHRTTGKRQQGAKACSLAVRARWCGNASARSRKRSGVLQIMALTRM